MYRTLLSALAVSIGVFSAPMAFAQGIDVEATSGTTLQQSISVKITFVPETSVLTRGDFVAMVVQKLYVESEINRCFSTISSEILPQFSMLYTDVSTESQYAHELCIAMRDGIARGYDDGSFKPNRSIRFDEASKILSRAYGLVSDKEAAQIEPWFRPYVQKLASRNAIPTSVTKFSHRMKRSESLDMLIRVSEGITWKPSLTYAEVEKMSAVPVRKYYTSRSNSFVQEEKRKNDAASSSSSSKAPWYKFF